MFHKLPVANDCQGCGVCCLHMGYPTFIRSVPPLSAERIAADPDLRRQAEDEQTRRQLLAGQAGEPYWEQLPDQLKQQLDDYIQSYQPPAGELDGPCIWLDRTSRRCKHHQYRPRVCRDFRVGSRGCQDWREHYRDLIG
jgi:Fe-S-cluster containining protein